MIHYNLTDERWIPCTMRADNNGRELNLREIFAYARDIAEIADPSPLVTVALHRLILAILHRNFGPSNLAQWQDLWNRGRWDLERLDAYLSHWRHRFELFDEARPFYQVPRMLDVGVQPVATLAMELTSGNNATLFDHSFDDSSQAMTAGRAARYVLARQAFSIGFGKSNPFYLRDSPLTRGYTALVQGDNLFETLMLNLIRYNEQRPLPHNGRDLPRWEQESPAHPDREGTPPCGYLDYLTWQSRRIHLLAEGSPPLVRECQVQQNLRLAVGVLDPFKSYTRDEKSGFVPRGFRPDKAVWRDSHTLFQRSSQVSKRAEVFEWLARIDELRQQGAVRAHSQYSFGLYGFATEVNKSASVILWRSERLPLPLAYLRDSALLERLRAALALIESVKDALRKGMQRLARTLLFPEVEKLNQQQRDDTAALVRSLGAEQSYWSRLETPFRRLLVDLERDRQVDELDFPEVVRYGATVWPAWTGRVELAAKTSFREATRGLDGSARNLKAVALAERTFNYELRRALGEPDQTGEQEGEPAG
jgi:CRISPR system Cascade subunit CasA